jgi:hypothetical protein
MKKTIIIIFLNLLPIFTSLCQTIPLEIERYELSTDICWFESKLSSNAKRMYDEIISEFDISIETFEIFYNDSYVEFMNQIKNESFTYVTYLTHGSNVSKTVTFDYKYKDSIDKKISIIYLKNDGDFYDKIIVYLIDFR